MEQKLNYKEKFYYSYLIPIIVFIGLAIACKTMQFGIRFKNLKLLDYPNSFYFMCLCALLFIVYVGYKYFVAQQANKNPNPIVLSDDRFTFPKGATGKIEVKYADVNELWNKADSDDGEQMILYVNNDKDRYEFSEDNFDNPSDFKIFKDKLKTSCTNITNK